MNVMLTNLELSKLENGTATTELYNKELGILESLLAKSGLSKGVYKSGYSVEISNGIGYKSQSCIIITIPEQENLTKLLVQQCIIASEVSKFSESFKAEFNKNNYCNMSSDGISLVDYELQLYVNAQNQEILENVLRAIRYIVLN